MFSEPSAIGESEEVVTRSVGGGSDPFAIDAMQSALDMLARQNPSIQSVTLRPTDYYVKFNPQDSLQMDALEELDIELFNHPLDNGVYTETEPEDVSEDSPIIYEPLYSVVPANFVFPEGVDYEIIHGVFIQRGDRLSVSEERQLPMDLYNSVFDASMRLTGNAPATRAADDKAELVEVSARVRYVTSGDFYKISADTIPLEGAKVRMYFHTLLGTGITDANGETPLMGMVNGKVGYDIIWDNPMWTMYVASKNQIRTTSFGTGHSGPLDAVINTGGCDGVLAGAHTALYSYFYKDYQLTHGLKKPAKRIRIAFMNKSGRSNTAPARPMREIFFYAKKSKIKTYNQSEEAMSAMFHELGHISHNRLNSFNYSFTAHSKYGESWATGVEYAYMKSFFPEYEYTHYSSENKMYKHVMQCMFKSGFTMEEIQFGFNAASSSGWEGWHEAMKENVINRWTDRSEEEKARMRQFIDIIFAHPNDMTFDLRDLIEAETDTPYKNQVIRFKLTDDARKLSTGDTPHISVVKWETVGAGEVVVPDYYDNTYRFLYFTEAGKKTIRMTARIFGTDIVYEKQLNVSESDIIEFPEQVVVGRKATFSLRQPLADAGVKVTKWSPGDTQTKLEWSGPQMGHFTFKEKGIRKIKAKILYPLLGSTVSYENIEVSVEDAGSSGVPEVNPGSGEIFYILDRPQSFFYNTPYRAKYMPVEEEITTVEKIEFNHYSALFYHDFDTWSFDAGTGILTFSIPTLNTYIDYILMIYYKVKNSDEIKTYPLFVSNIR